MERPTSRGGPRRPVPAAALLAAVLAAAAFCAGDALARVYPFGPRTRDVNDLGNQYVPFHAHLWDLLHGRADGGLLVNWQSGYGSSFLPDLGTYLSSPFAPLVALFPRDGIDLAVYAITVLKTASAAAAMAWLLLTLRPGRWWAAGLLGAAYALCGWSVADASYNPMWLDGLVALPLLCLAGEWTIARRRPVADVLVVALAWTANFYTGYMATLGAGLVLLLRLLLCGPPWRRALATAGRAALGAVLGTGLAAPLVAVVWFGTRHAYPGRVRQFAPVGSEHLLARLLPATYGWGTPALYVGVTALLLALALPFHRAVPARVRAGWTLLVLAVTLSLQWTPTHLVWHAFATPQGSPYRQTFVLCGLLVIAAWHTLSHGPPPWRALAAAAGLLALITALASRSGLVRGSTWPVLLLATAGALGGLALLRLADTGPRGRAPAALAVVLLLGAQTGEAAATSAVASRQRLAHLDDYAPWGQRQQRQAAAVAGADDWPRHRTDPGREQTVANDPMLVGGQGAQYYSSLTSDVLSRTLTALGGGWTSRGRSVQSLDNAVTDVVFSVGARVHSPPDPHQDPHGSDGAPGAGPPAVSHRAVPPLVTVRAAPARTPFGPSPYRNQEMLLGSRVYTVPRIAVHDDTGRPDPGRRVGSGTAVARPAVTARCPAGSQVYLWAPHFSGRARLDGAAGDVRFRFQYPRARAAMEPLGRAPASGAVRIALAPDRPGVVPGGAVGCLDTGRLRTAAARLTATGATEVTVSDGTLRARLPAGSRGVAVVAAPRIAGWRCAAGDAPTRPAGSYHGLIAVPLDGESASLTCTFHPPGLRLGTAVGGASLLTLALLAAFGAVRRRRAPAPPTTSRPTERVPTASRPRP